MIEYEKLGRKGLSLDRLVTLCRVVDANGISKAAKGNLALLSLYSRQIKELESYFGVALTRKVKNTAELTDAARRLATLARGHFKDVIAFSAEAGSMSVPLTIGGNHSLFEWWLIPRLKAIDAKLPQGTRVRCAVMRSAELAQALEARQLDIALVRDDALPRTMKSRPLLDVRYALFVPKALAVPGASLQQLLERLPLALSQGGQFRDRFDSKVQSLGLRVNVALDAPSFTLAAQAARTGRFAAVLPDFAREPLRHERLQVVDIGWKELAERKIVLAWHPRASDRTLRALLDAVSSAAGR